MSSEKFLSDLQTATRTAEVPDLLAEREQELIATSWPVIFAGAGQRATFNYIHPKSTLKASAYSKGFKLDDASSYALFATHALDLAVSRDDESSDTIVLKAAQLALVQYMGFPGENADRKRKRLLGGVLRGRPRGITEMATSGVAMCMERAAVTHNMCLLAGLPSIFLTGMARTDRAAGHAFQIVDADNEEQLFDSSNPSVEIKDGAGLLKPTLAKVTTADFLTGAAVVNAQVETRIDITEQTVGVQYSFQPAFPATFEGFDALDFQARQSIGSFSQQGYRLRGILDISQNLAESAFAKG